MATTVFPLTTVVNVSVATPPTAVNEYNTSNLAIITTEAPNLGTFGSLGYALYNSPTQVGIDFGSTSRTFQMANAIFSQNPNILLGDGQLIVILQKVATQTLVLSGTPATGATELTWGGNNSVSILYNANASTIQSAIQGIPGLSGATSTGTFLANDVVVTMNGVYGTAPSLFSLSANTMGVTLSSATNSGGESIGTAITRTQGLVQYFGVLSNHTLAIIGQTDLLAAAAVVQPLPLMFFPVSYATADILPGGMIDLIRTGSFTQTRCLFYEDSSSGGINAVLYAAAYAGRALCVDFSGSLTTITMNLKQLVGIVPDPNITTTYQADATAAGADVYLAFGQTSVAGAAVGDTLTSGTNQFFDNIYNILWFSGAIQVAYFNYLAQTSTKILQTEDGMTGLNNALRQVCLQGVGNGFLAQGIWNSPTTFGNLTAFYANIAQTGFYIYTSPISQQSETDRANRKAPLIQVAVKYAGALQSGQVIINVNL